MHALVFRVETIQPVLVTQPAAGEENSARSYDHIPGSVLRGLLIGRYMQTHPVDDLAGDPFSRRLFFDGTVVYLNAYPTTRLGERSLPKPLSWMISRHDSEATRLTVYDMAVASPNEVDELVSVPGMFCWRREDGNVEIVESQRYTAVHNATYDRRCKTKKTSSVYHYEALSPGQSFSSAIVSVDSNCLRTLKALLEVEPTGHLGGSRSAGYGLVHFGNIEIIEDWSEYQPDSNSHNRIAVLTLLSDAILRDPETGEYTTDLDRVLGHRHIRAFARTRIVGGFNRKWGLPLQQAPALQAGSTFVYDASDLNTELLNKLRVSGIGERRAEGFGRVSVNWHTQPEIELRRGRPSDDRDSRKMSMSSLGLAKRILERSVRAHLDRKVLKALDELAITNLTGVTSTQLSRLRVAVSRAWREDNREVVINHLDNLKNARIQFERARVGNESLSMWIKNGLTEWTIWNNYLRPQECELPSIGDVPLDFSDSLKTEYTMRLLDGLLKRSINEKQQQGGGDR